MTKQAHALSAARYVALWASSSHTSYGQVAGCQDISDKDWLCRCHEAATLLAYVSVSVTGPSAPAPLAYISCPRRIPFLLNQTPPIKISSSQDILLIPALHKLTTISSSSRIEMDAASTSGQEQQGRHRTVGSEPPKRLAGRTKFHETRHPLYRGVRRRGRVGQWVCEMRVHGTKGSRLWLGTFATAEMAAHAHDAAALALSGPAACLNFPDSAWRMLPVLAAAREIKAAVAFAVVAFQLRPVAESSLIAQKDVDGSPTTSALFYMSSGDLLELDDEHWFGGMVAGPYYESLAPGMLVEPPDAGAWREDGGVVETPLWSYLFE